MTTTDDLYFSAGTDKQVPGVALADASGTRLGTAGNPLPTTPIAGSGALADRASATKVLNSAAGSGDKTLVKAGAGTQFTFEAVNNVTTGRWAQFFDAAATADVTLGTTTPFKSVYLPPQTVVVRDWKRSFSLGLVVALTTTATGASGVTAADIIGLSQDYA